MVLTFGTGGDSINTSGVGTQCFTLMGPWGSCLPPSDELLGSLCAQSNLKIVLQHRIACSVVQSNLCLICFMEMQEINYWFYNSWISQMKTMSRCHGAPNLLFMGWEEKCFQKETIICCLLISAITCYAICALQVSAVSYDAGYYLHIYPLV